MFSWQVSKCWTPCSASMSADTRSEDVFFKSCSVWLRWLGLLDFAFSPCWILDFASLTWHCRGCCNRWCSPCLVQVCSQHCCKGCCQCQGLVWSISSSAVGLWPGPGVFHQGNVRGREGGEVVNFSLRGLPDSHYQTVGVTSESETLLGIIAKELDSWGLKIIKKFRMEG